MSLKGCWLYLTRRCRRRSLTPMRYARVLSPIMPEVIKILKTLSEHGFEAYIVGGGVRDLLAGIAPKDFDLVTDARPNAIKRLFKYSRVIGRRFRLVHVRYGRQRDEFVEVATFRGVAKRSWGVQSKHAHNNVYGSRETDVWRRDFSVNALLYDVQRHEVIDYCHGFEDIQLRIIRLLGHPDQRFQEDPVRVLRAIRLSAKLSFSIESKTEAALVRQCHRLSEASPDRLYLEVVKLFYSGHAQASWACLLQYPVLPVLFPSLSACFSEKGCVQQFLNAAFERTDARLAAGKYLNSAFLFAVLYWFSWRSFHAALAHRRRRSRKKSMESFLAEQQGNIALPHRCSEAVIAIWSLQSVLEKPEPAKVDYSISHARFRAAYDFFVLRASVGDASSEMAQWWTVYQAADHLEAPALLDGLSDLIG